MKQCWRWFGPVDPISLSDLHQVGVKGIVTALHDIPPGEVWPLEAIQSRQKVLRANDFDWDVVESLPVSEAIKTQGPETARHIANYKESLQALAQSGIRTICYNFMPILDWTRTALRAPQPHGGTAMAFDLIDFAAFDLFILKRKAARQDYDEALQEIAQARFASMDCADHQTLCDTIIVGLPGAADRWTLGDVTAHLSNYDSIDAEQLRANLIDFLAEVAPLAQSLGRRLCCHPDDPPFSLLGLPRVMSSTADYVAMLEAVDIHANGATLCTGSLGVAPDFDPVDFVQHLGGRIHFAHLRNTTRQQSPDPARPHFFEAAHLDGDTDMVATVRALIAEEALRSCEGREDRASHMRSDHWQDLLTDLGGHSTPGYPLIGRMRGLAELRGVMSACATGSALPR